MANKNRKGRSESDTRNGTARKLATNGHRQTVEITQRGIKSYGDIAEFYSAALSDIDAGRHDQKGMTQMLQVTRQIIAMENLRMKIAGKSNKKFMPLAGTLSV